jgi:tRNA threonylcarbamoyladenosine biosynthesis protein TsaB
VKVLGIESSGDRLEVAVIDGEAVLAERSHSGRHEHASALPGAIRDALAETGLELAGLDAIAVSGGPGAFTALRVGMATAKAIALAAELPLVAVSTLEALAHRPVLTGEETVLAALDARRGEVYWALFTRGDGGVRRLTEDALDSPQAAVAAALSGGGRPVRVVGSGAPLLTAVGETARLLVMDGDAGAAEVAPRAASVAALGAARIAQGLIPSLDDLEPRYIRPSDAEKLRSGSESRP